MKVGMTYDLRDDYLHAGYGAEETAEFTRAQIIFQAGVSTIASANLIPQSILSLLA